MTKAHQAQTVATYRGFATRVTEFTRVTVYDFADGSFLCVHFNGRTEVNTVNV